MQLPKTGVEGQLNIEPLIKFWPLMYSIIQEFWNITEPQIEDAAVRNNIPIELYLYSELGLDRFSIQDFQRRDPYSNPEQFERLFVWLVRTACHQQSLEAPCPLYTFSKSQHSLF